MRQHGGAVYAISVDPPEDNARVAKEDGLRFSILSDASHDTIRAYGLVHPKAHGSDDAAIPAQVLVAPDGRILWWRAAKRVQDRPRAEDVMATVGQKLGW
jgi:peroxiredoxin